MLKLMNDYRLQDLAVSYQCLEPFCYGWGSEGLVVGSTCRCGQVMVKTLASKKNKLRTQ